MAAAPAAPSDAHGRVGWTGVTASGAAAPEGEEVEVYEPDEYEEWLAELESNIPE